MFYSILESIDTDMCQWLRVNRGAAVLNLTFINYMLFFVYHVTQLEIVKYILTASLVLLIGLLSSYANALDKDYYAKRAEEEAVSDDTAVSESSDESKSATVTDESNTVTTTEESGEFVQTTAVAADTAEESDVETVHDTVVSGAVSSEPTTVESANTESSTTS